MSVESVTQAVSNLALAFGDDDPDPGAMVGSLPSNLRTFSIDIQPGLFYLAFTCGSKYDT